MHVEGLQCTRPTSLPDMELGHWVTGSMGHLGHLSRPGHRVILTRCETRVFPVTKLRDKYSLAWDDANLAFGAGYKYSYLLTYLVENSSTP